MTDDTQANVWDAVYAPFGREQIANASVVNPFRFPGQYAAPERDARQNGWREYDCETGRFRSNDPKTELGYPIRISAPMEELPATQYVAADPINRSDSSGLTPDDISDSSRAAYRAAKEALRRELGDDVDFQDPRNLKRLLQLYLDAEGSIAEMEAFADFQELKNRVGSLEIESMARIRRLERERADIDRVLRELRESKVCRAIGAAAKKHGPKMVAVGALGGTLLGGPPAALAGGLDTAGSVLSELMPDAERLEYPVSVLGRTYWFSHHRFAPVWQADVTRIR